MSEQMSKAEAARIMGTVESQIAEVREVETAAEAMSGCRDKEARHDHVAWLKNGIGYYLRGGKILKRL